jgi:hypothetical protein
MAKKNNQLRNIFYIKIFRTRVIAQLVERLVYMCANVFQILFTKHVLRKIESKVLAWPF